MYQELGMSKKQFKGVISRLLNQKKIFMFSDCISYVGNSTSNSESNSERSLNKKQRAMVAKNEEFKKHRQKNVKASVEQHYGLLDKANSRKRGGSKPLPLSVPGNQPKAGENGKRISSVDHAKRVGRGSSFLPLGGNAPTHANVPVIKDDRETSSVSSSSAKHRQSEEDDEVYSDSEATPEEWELSSVPMNAEQWEKKEREVAKKYGYQVLTMPGAKQNNVASGPYTTASSKDDNRRSQESQKRSESRYRSRGKPKRERSDSTTSTPVNALSEKDDELHGHENLELEVDDDDVSDLKFFERELGEMFGGYDEIQSDDEEHTRSLNKARESADFLSQRKLRQIRRAVHQGQVRELNRY